MDDKGQPETLLEVVKFFGEDNNAFDFMVQLRWPDGVYCPRCTSTEVRFIGTRKIWECKAKECRKQFSVKVGTIFEDSAIKLDKWFAAIWLVSNAKNGISSYEVHRSIGVTQKTAWFMMHRIRLALAAGSFTKLKGTVEVDESYIGGRGRFMHKHTKKRRGITGTGMVGKTAVMGLLERHSEKKSKIIAEVILTADKLNLVPRVKKYVEKGTEIHTDALIHYRSLKADFEHKVVDHAECYVKDNVHTNGLENFWSLFKRSIKGTYVSVEPFHLFRYLSEQVFRFNERKGDDQDRFMKAVGNVFGKGISYAKLIDSDHRLPTTA
jgi:transposase-like protein